MTQEKHSIVISRLIAGHFHLMRQVSAVPVADAPFLSRHQWYIQLWPFDLKIVLPVISDVGNLFCECERCMVFRFRGLTAVTGNGTDGWSGCNA